MQNANDRIASTSSRLSKKALAVSAALVVALSGGVAFSATRAMAAEVQPAAQQQVVYTWAASGSGGDAARTTGLSRFEVPGKIVVDDIIFQDPTFSTAGGVAQATYETGATQLIVRKGAIDKHTAPLTDRKETELPTKLTRNVDGLQLTLLGEDDDDTTVIVWKDGTVEYGVTFQGLSGEEMTMDDEEVAYVVRTIRDLNAEPTANATSQSKRQTNSKQAGQQRADSKQQATASNLISSDAAIKAAVSYVAGDNNVSNIGCELSSTGGEPRYIVTFHFDDADYIVKVGARNGSVWYATAVFNDGTTRNVDDRDDADDRADADEHDHDADDRDERDGDEREDREHDDHDHDADDIVDDLIDNGIDD